MLRMLRSGIDKEGSWVGIEALPKSILWVPIDDCSLFSYSPWDLSSLFSISIKWALSYPMLMLCIKTSTIIILTSWYPKGKDSQ